MVQFILPSGAREEKSTILGLEEQEKETEGKEKNEVTSDSCQGVCGDNGDISTLWEWRLCHSDVKVTQHTLLYTKVKSQGFQMVCFPSKFPRYSLESYFHHEVLMQSEANDIILLSEVISHDRSELLESGAARFI